MRSLTVFATLILLTACVQPESDATKSVEVGETPKVEKTEGFAHVGQHKFRVRHLPEKGYALVEVPKTRGQFNGQDVEDAAAQVTGCKSTIFVGDWAFLGDLRNFGLRELRPTMWNPHNAWRVDLVC